MKYKDKWIEDFEKYNISIYVDEEVYSFRFYDVDDLKYVYTNDKDTNYVNDFGVSMHKDDEDMGYFILKDRLY